MNEHLKVELKQLRATGRLKQFAVTRSLDSALVEHRGRQLLDFTSWDFLDVSGQQKIRRAVQLEIERHGLGVGSSRLSSGTLPNHIACEERVSKFFDTPSALLFSSKNQALLTLLTSLLTEQDVVVCEDLVHSPVIDAAYLVNAQVRIFESGNFAKLESELGKLNDFRNRYVFVESVSPVTGKIAALEKYALACRNSGAELIVDESFAIAALGIRGAGGVEHSGLKGKYFCQIGDLSTGVGGYGAFVAGDAELMTYLVNRSRTFTSEVAFPAAFATAAEEALGYIELQHAKRETLTELSKKLREGLIDRGLKNFLCGDSAVSSLVFASRAKASELQEALMEKGFLGDILPLGLNFQDAAALRLIVRATHRESHIDGLLQAFTEIIPKIELN